MYAFIKPELVNPSGLFHHSCPPSIHSLHTTVIDTYLRPLNLNQNLPLPFEQTRLFLK